MARSKNKRNKKGGSRRNSALDASVLEDSNCDSSDDTSSQASGSNVDSQASGSNVDSQASGSNDGSQASGSNGGSQASGSNGGSQASGSNGGSQASGSHGGSQASGSHDGSQASGSHGGSQASGSHGGSQASGSNGGSQASGSKDSSSTESGTKSSTEESGKQSGKDSSAKEKCRGSSATNDDGNQDSIQDDTTQEDSLEEDSIHENIEEMAEEIAEEIVEEILNEAAALAEADEGEAEVPPQPHDINSPQDSPEEESPIHGAPLLEFVEHGTVNEEIIEPEEVIVFEPEVAVPVVVDLSPTNSVPVQQVPNMTSVSAEHQQVPSASQQPSQSTPPASVDDQQPVPEIQQSLGVSQPEHSTTPIQDSIRAFLQSCENGSLANTANEAQLQNFQTLLDQVSLFGGGGTDSQIHLERVNISTLRESSERQHNPIKITLEGEILRRFAGLSGEDTGTGQPSTHPGTGGRPAETNPAGVVPQTQTPQTPATEQNRQPAPAPSTIRLSDYLGSIEIPSPRTVPSTAHSSSTEREQTSRSRRESNTAPAPASDDGTTLATYIVCGVVVILFVVARYHLRRSN